jgi:alkanesulfonate monooxygenase
MRQTSSIRVSGRDIELFSTCLPSRNEAPAGYLERVVETARWSDEAGYRGMLVYTDNGLIDPWLISQVVLQHTERLCPLVAIQPGYMHPYTAAKMVSSLAFLHGRQIYLNMVAGGFRNDLRALGDDTPHDERYDRVVEYTLIVKRLLEGTQSVTFEGDYYQVKNLFLTPPLPPELFPGILISGSSDAGMRAADAGQVSSTAERGGADASERLRSGRHPRRCDHACKFRRGVGGRP